MHLTLTQELNRLEGKDHIADEEISTLTTDITDKVCKVRLQRQSLQRC